MAAPVIAATDQQPAKAHFAHFPEGDFLLVCYG
jgi:hypothetical protein